MKNILIIDGQGGRIGGMLVEMLKKRIPSIKITAVGTNSTATSVMLKAGADAGATGENPTVVCCRSADIIIGPLGIVIADALLGEVTPAMAVAVGQSPAEKLLIPVSKCCNTVIGIKDLTLSEYIELTVAKAAEMIEE